jgi:subtilisin family serine protease
MRNFGQLLALFVLLTAISCVPVDDQRLATSEMKKVANPTPTLVSPQQNQKHKVLVAVIDSGVDYNHPRLSQNIHYRYDESGRLVGTGFDFIGKDMWPSPYIVRTAQIAEKAKAGERKEAAEFIKGTTYFLSQHPEDSEYVNPMRAFDQENSAGAYHGTHVAGLIAYDNPSIGLLPYRVLPHNKEWVEDNLSAESILPTAINQAVKDGAKVVNLSLGAGIPESQDANGAFVAMVAQLQKIIKANPQTVFVAAAGNDGSWLDGERRLGYPCGVKAENLICVGALDDQERLTEFTNVPLVEGAVVYTLGKDVLSTMPTNMCWAIERFDSLASLHDATGNDHITDLIVMEMHDEVEKKCHQKRNDFGYLSGTSMAAPLIAHVAAEILIRKPHLKGAQVIQEILGRSREDRMGPLTVNKLRAQKPSWYRDPAVMNHVHPPENKGLDGEAFEFFVIK